MSVTIKDVAKKAGVAPSTVSRVIAESPKISKETKKKVRKVMDELGYHLNLNARNLVQKSTKTIGIVLKNSASQSLLNPVFPEILNGISAFCHQEDFSIILTSGSSEEEIFQDTVKIVQGKKVDGIIVMYSKKDDKVVPYLSECGIPFLVIGKPVFGLNEVMYVDNDNVFAAKQATDYLIKLGHRQIAFISAAPNYEVSVSRCYGYKLALTENNLEIKESYIKSFQIEQKDPGKQAVTELMQMTEPPTALLIADDLQAMLVLLILRELKIKVPEDVSIVAFNNTIISRLSSPPLTSVNIQTYQLGYEAARCLIEQIKEPDSSKKSVIIPTNMEERESCLAINHLK
ncbi:LacI family DNA-binding transcriptional regulator [Bacillus sp. CRN 9]|nr:LacI family DNA-binding transcriptional regulator [Bacillus sp. CRN 9]